MAKLEESKKCLHCGYAHAKLEKIQIVQSEKRVKTLDRTGVVIQTTATATGDWVGSAVGALADPQKEAVNEAAKEAANEAAKEAANEAAKEAANEAAKEAVTQSGINISGEFLGHVGGTLLGLGVGVLLSLGIKKLFSNQQENGVYKCPKCNQESIYSS